MCESQDKQYQTVAEYYNLPIYVIDVPLRAHGVNGERRESHIRHLVTQLNDALEKYLRIAEAMERLKRLMS